MPHGALLRRGDHDVCEAIADATQAHRDQLHDRCGPSCAPTTSVLLEARCSDLRLASLMLMER